MKNTSPFVIDVKRISANKNITYIIDVVAMAGN
jgi:hypothetical protein